MAFNQKIQSMIIPVLESVETSANDVFTWLPEKPMLIRDVSVIVGEATVVASSAAPVFSLDHTTTAVSRAEKATLTVAHGTVIGTEVIASESSGVTWAPFTVKETDTLFFEHKTAATGGSSAGTVYFVLYYEFMPDGVV